MTIVIPPATALASIVLHAFEEQAQLYQDHIAFYVVMILIAKRCLTGAGEQMVKHYSTLMHQATALQHAAMGIVVAMTMGVMQTRTRGWAVVPITTNFAWGTTIPTRLLVGCRGTSTSYQGTGPSL